MPATGCQGIDIPWLLAEEQRLRKARGFKLSGQVRSQTDMKRTPVLKAVMLGLLGLSLNGCSSGGMGQQYVTRTASGQEVLTGVCLPGASAKNCEAMQPVRITTDPTDEEFWQFEARVQVRAMIGIPYGRMPRDVSIVGPQARCEAIRAAVLKDTPTEPCKGPFYFHRDTAP